MNKKSLIFLFILTLSMTVVNLFFKPNAKKEKETELVSNATSLEKKITSTAELPLVDIYSDRDAKHYLTSGVLDKGNILTLAWEDSLPQKVFYKKSHSNMPLAEVSLHSNGSKQSDPIVYSSEGKNNLNALELPKKGSVELQLIELKEHDHKPDVFSMLYKNGQLNTSSIENNAIALTKTEAGYQPVGVYLSQEKRLVPMKSFFNLKDILHLEKLDLNKQRSEETFYTLENEHQQLVFSNLGGAIAEINLPFKDEKSPTSQVFPIGLDKRLLKEDSPHSLFPAKSALTADKLSEKNPQKGGYYPLIRRSIDSDLTNPRYYALNIVSDHANLSDVVFEVKHFDKNKIVFEANQNHRKITKTYTLGGKSSPYEVDLSIKVDGDNEGLYLASGVPEGEVVSNVQNPALKYRHFKKNKFEISKQSLPKKGSLENTTAADWVSNSNGFFTIIMNPEDSIENGFKVNKVPTKELNSRITHVTPSAKGMDGYEFLVPLKETSNEQKFKIFAGPQEQSTLIQADQAQSKPSNYSGVQTYSGFLTFISEPVAKVLFKFLAFFKGVSGSWGIAIILLTIFIKLALYPLNAWSIKAMRKNQDIAPEVSAIQAKYKKNPKQAQVEIMKMYRKKKVNPLSGCLPMLIQMPFLLGMFSLLRSTFVLRGVPFIGGWISNLAAPDVLFTWSKSIPFFGTEFHLLPFLSIIIFFFQQKFSSSALPKDKSQMTDQQKQQKMMMYFLPVFMALVCYSLPAGLNIYFIFSTLLGIVQQVITNKMIDRKANKSKVTITKKAQEA